MNKTARKKLPIFDDPVSKAGIPYESELTKDWQTGDLTIFIPDGIKITSRKLEVRKIRITEECMEDHGKLVNDDSFLLDIEIP